MNRFLSDFFNRKFVAYTIGTAIRSLLTVTTPFLLGKFVDSLIYGGNAIKIFVVLLSVALGAYLLDFMLRRAIIGISRNLEQNMQIRLLSAFQQMKPSAIDVYKNGEIGMKFFRDAAGIQQFFFSFYPQLLNVTFGFVFALGVVLCKKPSIALLYILFLPLMAFSLSSYAKRITRTTHAIRTMYDKSINRIFEFMHIFPYLKSMDADNAYFSEPKQKFRTYRRMNALNDRTICSLEYLNRLLLLFGEYSILGVAGWMAWEKIIPVGDVVVFQVLFLSVLNSFSSFFQLLPNWKSVQESVQSILELLDSKETEDIEIHDAIPSCLSDITLKDISFRYPNSKTWVFQNFSHTLKAGTMIALTGKNGSGKTTLMKLMTGYLLPDSGTVEIAGRDLQDWQKKSFRQRISYVFQDSLLITGTIRENITLKNKQYTDDEISEALRLSGADELVARLPDGLEHKIGFEGGGLSGGERQKVAIARALIRKPEILIFDEVTNHLDYESRMRMKSLLQEMKGKTTVLLVSHDPELVSLCDSEIKLDMEDENGKEEANE